MTTWNYRVMRHRAPVHLGADTWLDIREVYYDDAGNIDGWTADEAGPYGETLVELSNDLGYMVRALTEPILNEWELPGYENEDNRRSSKLGRLFRKEKP